MEKDGGANATVLGFRGDPKVRPVWGVADFLDQLGGPQPGMAAMVPL